MVRIIGGRSQGKTRQLMEMVKENHGVLVCENPYSMRAKAQAYGLTGFDIISYQALFNAPNKNEPYYIDEMETFVKNYYNINGYTLSTECNND